MRPPGSLLLCAFSATVWGQTQAEPAPARRVALFFRALRGASGGLHRCRQRGGNCSGDGHRDLAPRCRARRGGPASRWRRPWLPRLRPPRRCARSNRKLSTPAKGDEARLSAADEIEPRARRTFEQARRHYLQVLEFTEGDPLDDELREYVPRPPSEEVNRLRGRIAYRAHGDHRSRFPGRVELGKRRGDPHRLVADRRQLLDADRLLAGQPDFHSIGIADYAARPDEPHLSDRPVLRESEIPVEVRHRPPDSAMGQQPGRDRRRLCGAKSVAQGDGRNIRRDQSRSDAVELRSEPANGRLLRQFRNRELRWRPLEQHGRHRVQPRQLAAGAAVRFSSRTTTRSDGTSPSFKRPRPTIATRS